MNLTPELRTYEMRIASDPTRLPFRTQSVALRAYLQSHYPHARTFTGIGLTSGRLISQRTPDGHTQAARDPQGIPGPFLPNRPAQHRGRNRVRLPSRSRPPPMRAPHALAQPTQPALGRPSPDNWSPCPPPRGDLLRQNPTKTRFNSRILGAIPLPLGVPAHQPKPPTWFPSNLAGLNVRTFPPRTDFLLYSPHPRAPSESGPGP